jgi:hypothetical protein
MTTEVTVGIMGCCSHLLLPAAETNRDQSAPEGRRTTERNSEPGTCKTRGRHSNNETLNDFRYFHGWH